MAFWDQRVRGSMLRCGLLAVAALGGWLALAAPACATLQYSLAYNGTTYGTVTTADSTNATTCDSDASCVVVTVALSKGDFFSTQPALNFNLTGVTTPITVTNATPDFSLSSRSGGSYASSSDGTFGFQVVCNDGSSYCDATNTFSFTILLAGSQSFSTNAAGYAVYSAICIVSSGTTCEGSVPAAAKAGSPVPEPAPLAVLGSALAGLGLIRRRR